MPRNPHRPGASASTSLRATEIEWLEQVLATLRRGGDVSGYARRLEAQSIARKVASMQRSLRRQLQERDA